MIRQKNLILSIIAIAAVLVMATLQYKAVRDYRTTGEIRVLVSDIESNMLTLRRNEKDFLARKDPQYAVKFMDNFQVIRGNVEALRLKLQAVGADDLGENRLGDILDTYKSRFLSLVELQKQIGFDHEEGLYGRLRAAIHEVEDLLTTHRQDRLSKDMLMLRRHEKDFMLRHDMAYVDRFDLEIKAMQSNLSKAYIHPRVKSEITAALTAYEKDFNSFVSVSKQIGLNSGEGLRGEMQGGIHQGEEILSEIRKGTLALEGSTGSDMIEQLIAFAGIVLALVFSVSWIS